MPSLFPALLAVVALLVSSGRAHSVITYPLWRGDNLITNNTWPYGMQWEYPCGGIQLTTNRTKWPINGGSIAVQPGWFQGHSLAFFRVNIGFGTDGPDGGPLYMDTPIVDLFQIVGPSNNPWPGTICLQDVQVPASSNATVGDNATIQVILTAQHGAPLFACADITFAEAADAAPVNSTTCFNSTDVGFNQIYTMARPKGT